MQRVTACIKTYLIFLVCVHLQSRKSKKKKKLNNYSTIFVKNIFKKKLDRDKTYLYFFFGRGIFTVVQ